MEDIASKVTRIVRDELGLEGSVLLTDRIDEDLGADSLDRYELSFALEQAFQIEIGDDESAPLQTVGQVIRFIEDKVTTKTKGAA